MKTTIAKISFATLVVAMLLAACSTAPLSTAATSPTATAKPAAPTTSAPAPVSSGQTGTGLAAYESALENIYAAVNPSVVSIEVTTPQGQALGSGFVWDDQGHIVTNDHVVADATRIQVKFSDGSIVAASLVGADADSDLAVIKVDKTPVKLVPIQVGDSTKVKVGQVAVAIGNPFGLENTMTAGIVSAIGRTISASTSSTNLTTGQSFSIPDVIQTDAPINPGNSGGPLVDDQGSLIGVNSQIESSGQSNAGIGFAIPSALVSKVVPALIKDGKYEHPYLGITGTTLTPDLATAMKLDSAQRGVLVVAVSVDGPASKAGLIGSSQTTTINGQDVNVGGDVITAAGGKQINTMDDLIAFLSDQTTVGQKVQLDILRDGKSQAIEVTLTGRPNKATVNQTKQQSNVPSGTIWLGVNVQPLTAEIASQMGLAKDQSGLLIEQVESGSPADDAGLHGSFKPVLINGKRVLIGGDVITAVDGQAVTKTEELVNIIQNSTSGQEVTISIIRDGKQMDLQATLAERP